MWSFLNLVSRLATMASSSTSSGSRLARSATPTWREAAWAAVRQGVGGGAVEDDGRDKPEPRPSETVTKLILLFSARH